jgi:hypothetical protein
MFSFGHRFVHPQNAKLTPTRFKIHVVPKKSVQIGVKDVVASAIDLLAFAPCFAEHMGGVPQFAADALGDC